MTTGYSDPTPHPPLTPSLSDQSLDYLDGFQVQELEGWPLEGREGKGPVREGDTGPQETDPLRNSENGPWTYHPPGGSPKREKVPGVLNRLESWSTRPGRGHECT